MRLLTIAALASVAIASPLSIRDRKVSAEVKGNSPKLQLANQRGDFRAEEDDTSPGIAGGLQKTLQVQGWLHNDVDLNINALNNAISSGRYSVAQSAQHDLLTLRAELADAQSVVDPITAAAVRAAIDRIDASVEAAGDLKSATSGNADVLAKIKLSTSAVQRFEDALRRCGCQAGAGANKEVDESLAVMVDLRAQLRSSLGHATGPTQANAQTTINQLDTLVGLSAHLFTDLPPLLAQLRARVNAEGSPDLDGSLNTLKQLQTLRASLEAGKQMGGNFGERSDDGINAINAAFHQAGDPLVNEGLARLRASLAANSASDCDAAHDVLLNLRAALSNAQPSTESCLANFSSGLKASISNYLSNKVSSTLAQRGDMSPMVAIMAFLQNLAAPLGDAGLIARLVAARSSCQNAVPHLSSPAPAAAPAAIEIHI